MRDDDILKTQEELNAPVPPPTEEQSEDSFLAPDPLPVSKSKEVIGSFLSGSFLTKAEVRRVYPYMIALFIIMLLYITNVFNMQQLYNRHSKLQQQVKELRARSSTITGIKMNATRQSEIIKTLGERGIDINESLTPPKVIDANE